MSKTKKKGKKDEKRAPKKDGETTIFKRIKNRKGQECGIVMALPRPGKQSVAVTYSLCHISEDTYDRKMGELIALGKVLKWEKETPPHSLKKEIEAMVGRATAYFKGAKSVKVVGE